MPSVNDFKSRRPAFTLLLNGYFGTGKSLQAHSFPKCYTLSIDPGGLETLRQPKNKKFLDNLVWYEELNQGDKQDLKELFRENAKSTERTSLFGCIAHAKELAAKNEIETLVVDGGSFLVDLIWAKIVEFEEVKSANTGQRDSQAMYRSLGIYLQRLFATELLTLATRNALNCVVTFHLKRESQEQIEGGPGGKRARKVILNSDMTIQCEGGFRNKVEGLFGGSLYLDKTLKEGKVNYTAICDVTTAFGTVVMGKNRWGLPARLGLNEKPLYDVLMETLNLKAQGQGQTTTTAPVAKVEPPQTTQAKK